MRRRQMRSVELRKLTGSGQRCRDRHPNLHGVRCERPGDTEHYYHHAESRTFEWYDQFGRRA